MTKGEYLVETNFNPVGSGPVHEVKMRTAELVDQMEELRTHTRNEEQARCAAIAATKYEEAAMWAVKAITKEPEGFSG
jgi:hypothetical protein